MIRALSRIQVDTTTSPESLIHMLTTGRVSCIVFSEDDSTRREVMGTLTLELMIGLVIFLGYVSDFEDPCIL